jgi:hypothetical protein
MDHSVGTLVPAKVALIHHCDLHNLIRRMEGVATEIARIARHSAHQRIAHILCEMATKLRMVALNDGHTGR